MTPQDVRTATQADRESILDTFVLSFAADPCARYLWPKPADFPGLYSMYRPARG